MFKESSEFKEFINYISSKGKVLGLVDQKSDTNVELFFGNDKTKKVDINDTKKYHNNFILMYLDFPEEELPSEENNIKTK